VNIGAMIAAMTILLGHSSVLPTHSQVTTHESVKMAENNMNYSVWCQYSFATICYIQDSSGEATDQTWTWVHFGKSHYPTQLFYNPTPAHDWSYSPDPTHPNPTLPNIGHTAVQKSKPIFLSWINHIIIIFDKLYQWRIHAFSSKTHITRTRCATMFVGQRSQIEVNETSTTAPAHNFHVLDFPRTESNTSVSDSASNRRKVSLWLCRACRDAQHSSGNLWRQRTFRGDSSPKILGSNTGADCSISRFITESILSILGNRKKIRISL